MNHTNQNSDKKRPLQLYLAVKVFYVYEIARSLHTSDGTREI